MPRFTQWTNHYRAILARSLGTLLLLASASACSLKFEGPEPVPLPYMKNAANECYYLDQFMPTADALTSGRSDGLNLRYYNYKIANYKDWKNQNIVLSFYSKDNSCWSLFEEYVVAR